MKQTKLDNDLSAGFSIRASADAEPIFTFNYADFAQEMGDMDASDEESEALLRTIWNGIIVPSVQMGWGIHPIDQALDQQSEKPCGSFDENGDHYAFERPDMVELTADILAARFGEAAQEHNKGGTP